MKKIISLALALVMVMSLNPVVYSVEPAEYKSVEEILDSYHLKIFDINNDLANRSTYSLNAVREKNQIRQETLQELADAGYEAYDVNSETYASVENVLQTDLAELGLNPDGEYIVVVSGEPEVDNCVAPAAVTPPPPIDGEPAEFMYTYDGETFIMRYLTITASQGYGYAMSEDIDLVEDTNNIEEVESWLNATVYFSLDSMCALFPVGTILSILGVQLYNFNTPISHVTMKYNANTNWTRVFTQVWNDLYDDWTNGSCVEYAKSLGYIDCDYYDPVQNGFQDVRGGRELRTTYSSYYNNYSWRKQKGALGYLWGHCYFDQTGPIRYYYEKEVNGETLLTLITTHHFIGVP